MKLKPCPFCGANPIAYANIDNDQWIVQCRAAQDIPREEDLQHCFASTDWYEREVDATVAWNVRVLSAAKAGVKPSKNRIQLDVDPNGEIIK